MRITFAQEDIKTIVASVAEIVLEKLQNTQNTSLVDKEGGEKWQYTKLGHQDYLFKLKNFNNENMKGGICLVVSTTMAIYMLSGRRCPYR